LDSGGALHHSRTSTLEREKEGRFLPPEMSAPIQITERGQLIRNYGDDDWPLKKALVILFGSTRKT
jgi:hypothetical protein